MAEKTCSVCADPVYAKGFCKLHYDRQYRGTALDAPYQDHFRKWASACEKVLARSVWEGDCLVYTGARDSFGYGRVGIPGTDRSMLAHRAAAEHVHGKEAIKGKVICHTCDNPPCVNISHLRIGTMADDIHDMMAKGRGRGQFKPRISDEDVAAIRADTRRHVDIAAEYGINQSTVSRIKSGKRRKV